MRVNGEFTRAGKATKYAAYIMIDNVSRKVILVSDDTSMTYLFSEFRLSEQLGSLPDSLFFDDGHCFTSSRGVSLHNMITAKQKLGSFIHFLERRRIAVIGAVAGIIIALYFYFLIAVPAIASAVSHTIPDDFSRGLGEYTLSTADQRFLSESRLSAEKQQMVTALFRSVIPEKLKNDPLPLRIIFRDSEQGANAFTLPDGTIIITDDLVNLAENEDELAAIFLHEMGHHYHRHVLRSVISSSVLMVSVLWLTGDVHGMEDTLMASGSALFTLHYSRDMETGADEFAVRELKNQNRDPENMKAVLIRLSALQENNSNSLLSTHPGWENRLKTVDETK